MRKVVILPLLAALLLLLLYPSIVIGGSPPAYCPPYTPPSARPPAVLAYRQPGVNDAITLGDYLLVALQNGIFALYKLDNITLNVTVNTVQSPLVWFSTFPGFANATLKPVSSDTALLIASTEALANTSVSYATALIRVLHNPLRLQFTRLLGVLGTVKAAYYMPNGPYRGDYIVFVDNGRVYAVERRPNHVRLLLELNESVTRVIALRTCDGRIAGFLVEAGGVHVYLLDVRLSPLLSIDFKGSILDAYYDTQSSIVYILGLEADGKLVRIVITPMLSVEVTTLEVEAPVLARIYRLPDGVYAALYYPPPTSILRAVRLDNGAIAWSIPVDGVVTRIYRVDAGCFTQKLLLVYRGYSGRTTLGLIDAPHGLPLWVLLLGVPLDNSTAIHYTGDWLIAKSSSTIYLVHIPTLLLPLYSVPFNVMFDGVPITYTLRIQCIGGACHRLPKSIIVANATGPITVPLPPGTYRAIAYTKLGVYTISFTIPSTCYSTNRLVLDPLLAQQPTYIRIKAVNAKLCVWSLGDPQGWGFDSGPVFDAEIRIVRLDVNKTIAILRTGVDGCATLRLAPGYYRVSVAALGYHNETLMLYVPTNATKIRKMISIRPLSVPVEIVAIARDTNERLKASLVISCCGKQVTVRDAKRVLLPMGSYQFTISAEYYDPVEVQLNITLGDVLGYQLFHKPKLIRVFLNPHLYTILIKIRLQRVFTKNATFIVYFERVKPMHSVSIKNTYVLSAGVREVVVKTRLPWGSYRASIYVPLHLPANITFEVPKTKTLETNLQVVKYRLEVSAIDALTSRPITNGTIILRGAGGFKLEARLGEVMLVPYGNYTITIKAPHYNTLVKKIFVNKDTRLVYNLEPLRVSLQVYVYLGQNPLPNTTVDIRGVSFNGKRVSMTIVTDKNGYASVRLMPGTYTVSTSYTVRSLFASLTLNASKTVVLGDTPLRVELHIPPSILIYLVHILPLLLLVIILITVALLLFILRRRFAESMRRLREALVERLGGGRTGGEEFEEDIF